jgi:hypothetical protein
VAEKQVKVESHQEWNKQPKCGQQQPMQEAQ